MAGVVQIGKRRWLAGMTWASYEDEPNKVELREDATRLNATWSALRIGEACVQAGFCSAVEGAKTAKLYSLAAMLADSNEQPWLGIFKIEEDLWWYVAVRDGCAILPDGDVLGGREAIYAARERHSGYTDWKYIEGDLALLEDLIKRIDYAPTRVKALEGSPKLQKLLVGAGIIGLACIAAGGYWWEQEQERARQEAMARMREQLANASQEAKLITATPATTMPFAADMLAACANAVSIPISEYGWVVNQVGCAGTSATAVWIRLDGATIESRPDGDLSEDGNKVTQSIELHLEQQSYDDRIQLDEAWERLQAWTQVAGFQLTSVVSAPVHAALPGAVSDTPPPPPAPQKNVTIAVNVSPFGLDLSDLPGLRLTNIKMTERGWDLVGVLYGN